MLRKATFTRGFSTKRLHAGVAAVTRHLQTATARRYKRTAGIPSGYRQRLASRVRAIRSTSAGHQRLRAAVRSAARRSLLG